MNPYVNNFLDDAPAAHPTLINNPPKHNTGSHFGGAAALDPWTSRHNTPQLLMNHENFHQHNPGSHFGGAAALDPCTSHPNTPQNLQKQLDYVSTWGLDTIRQVATDIYNNPDLAFFDLQDRSVSGPSETTPPPACGWNDGEYNYEEETDVYGSTNHASPPAGGESSRRRKVKMHEWPPQSDPKLEKRRLRALREFLKRRREHQEEAQLQNEYDDIMREARELAPEAERLRQRIQMLELSAAQQGHAGGC
ncbi:uncharacterized protein LOC126986774 [Eriocheir sinensis]|uniref:uncharacterized protein LOC126986774 n=1 Tax=Eriocheir sinensis TaxID=95602 RepID=UPI0021C62689|nr:uncharacterized protein LOC126986774 [Eriocheir sinensis]